MAKTSVEEWVRSAREDALFDQVYTSPAARIRRAMSETLFRLRKGLNLTQAALAERAGWQQPYVAKIERGDAQMITALEGLENFANAVETTVVVTFVDPKTSHVRAQVSLGEAPIEAELNRLPETLADQVTLVKVEALKALQTNLEHVTASVERLSRRGLDDIAEYEVSAVLPKR